MDLLLDTCAFIWWDSGGHALSSAAAVAVRNPENRLQLSYASIWEMQLKGQKGKLLLRKSLAEIIRDQCTQNGLQLLAIEPEDIYNLGHLPSVHADPFDRIIHFSGQTARVINRHRRRGIRKIRRARSVVMAR